MVYPPPRTSSVRDCSRPPGEDSSLPAEQAACAEELGDRPGLERAAGGAVRRVAVGRLGHRPETPLVDVRLEAVEHAVDGYAGPTGSLDVRPDEPRPDRSLVIGTVAVGRTSSVQSEVARVGGVQAAQAE